MIFRDWDRFLRRYTESSRWHFRPASPANPDNDDHRGGAPRDTGNLPHQNGSELASQENSPHSMRWDDAKLCHGLRLSRLAHQRSPSAIKCALRRFIGDVPNDNIVAFAMFALDSARQLEPLSSFH